jgi:hypothetical protein
MPPNNQYVNQQPIVPTPPQMAGNPIQPQVPPPNLPRIKPTRNKLATAIIGVLFFAFIIAIGFAFWAYTGRQDYKNNTDQKIADAVKVSNADLKTNLEKAFAEKEKAPYKEYTTPVQYGSVKIVYSKMWSAYIVESASSQGTVVNAYMYPDYVPNLGDSNQTNYYLRFQVLDSSYNNEVNKYASLVKKGVLTSTPYVPEQVKGATVGVMLKGQLESKKNGVMVILPVRDKVLKIWSESKVVWDNGGDFENVVLKNLTYTP